MSNASRTDWERLASMPDDSIDTSDIPLLEEDFFKDAKPETLARQPVTVKLDPDVSAWFESQGSGYQARINHLLREYMQAHKHER